MKVRVYRHSRTPDEMEPTGQIEQLNESIQGRLYVPLADHQAAIEETKRLMTPPPKRPKVFVSPGHRDRKPIGHRHD